MELQIVDFETAKKLKELGFPQDYNEPIYVTKDCEREDGDYWEKCKEGDFFFDASGFNKDCWINCPTYELVKHWLIEKHKLYIEIAPTYVLHDKKTFKFENFIAYIRNLNDTDIKDYVANFTNKGNKGKAFASYDEALEWGVNEAIERLLRDGHKEEN